VVDSRAAYVERKKVAEGLLKVNARAGEAGMIETSNRVNLIDDSLAFLYLE
jgi:hypothetical protein